MLTRTICECNQQNADKIFFAFYIVFWLAEYFVLYNLYCCWCFLFCICFYISHVCLHFYENAGWLLCIPAWGFLFHPWSKHLLLSSYLRVLQKLAKRCTSCEAGSLRSTFCCQANIAGLRWNIWNNVLQVIFQILIMFFSPKEMPKLTFFIF